MTEIAEAWRPIPDWDGYYEASTLGRVRSVSRLVTFENRRGTQVERWLAGRVLRPHSDSGRGGYLSVNLSVGGEIAHREVHTLVCAAFHGPRPTGMQAAHNDGNPANCTPINLRWATPAENAQDKAGHGTLMFGEAHYATNLTAEDVREIRASPASLRVLSDRYGVLPQAVSKIRNRQAWRQVA